jgi:magnesium transporter
LRELHLAELSQRSNDVMQVLTVIAIMFMPMTFLAGLYGMNFDPEISPFNMPELRWYFGYPFALAVMALMELTLLGVLWYRGWLSGRWIS